MKGLPAVGRWLLAMIIATGSLAIATAAAAGTSGGVGGPSGGSGGKDGKAGSGGGNSTRAGAFPVRGHHSYGDGLGAGRGHQGQDLLAKCGKPVVASQPGKVHVKDYQGSGAGNYVVISGRSYDYVYMHLLRPSKLDRGDRVRTGQLLGRVGSTGRSSACHLHFEMWSKPGWYRGGGVVDPTPSLKKWDRRR